MQQMKPVFRLTCMAGVQGGNPRTRLFQQSGVGRHFCLYRIGVIGEQGELQSRLGIRQVMDFEPFEQCANSLFAGQHAGNDHQRLAVHRDALGEFNFWEGSRPQQMGHQNIHQGDRQFTGGEERQEPPHDGDRNRPSASDNSRRDSYGADKGPQGDAPDIEWGGVTPQESRERLAGARAVIDKPLEFDGPFVDQEESDVPAPDVGRLAPLGIMRQLGCRPGHMRLVEAAPLGNTFDLVTVHVASRKIHVLVNMGRIFAQGLFDQAHPFEKSFPVESAQQLHTGDHVADRHLIGRQPLLFLARQIVDRVDLQAQSLGHLCQANPPLFRIRFAQPIHQVHQQHRMRGSRSRRGWLRLTSPPRLDQPLGMPPMFPRRQNMAAQSPQVFYQHQPQHDRDGPDLAAGERRDALVGLDEARNELVIETAVGMHHQLVGQFIDPGKTGPGAFLELGELVIEPTRKVLADLAELFLDDVVIIEHPFGSRSDRLPVPRRLRDRPVSCCDKTAVALERIDKPPVVAPS